ncbi:uncharacterized protein LOC128337948 [Hemicordylus capensis]|uniref:uncharacterized protein LOC128337948 n=1 Tax=Hemicordylus capensis TaxID=884348 RepID=UPI0023039038|nr:uncharacterized protein LOC128337948 [Hemicordylus capensis]
MGSGSRALPSPRSRAGGWLHLLTAAAAALCFGGAEGKVYYSCGAQLSSMERGLILSPGFPNNYSSGMHCVWQFFIPARTYLMLEIFDFDVFESISGNPNAWDDFLPFPKNTKKAITPTEEKSDFSTVSPTKDSLLQDSPSKDFTSLHDRSPEATTQIQESKQLKSSAEPKELASTQPHGLPLTGSTNVSLLRQNTDGREENKDPKDKIWFAHLTARGGDKTLVEEVGFGENVTSPMVFTMDTSSTQQPLADVCPLDVLYVSDLIAFSSRFCGTNSPLNKNMTFGSSLKMVEVIVELITMTDRGRGFAMLFEYKNDTDLMDTKDSKEGKENIMMLVIITGILFFALVLLSTLCITCRQKLCPKRSSLDARCDQENGIQNAGIDINELRLVMPSQENENNNHSVGGNGAVTSCEGSRGCSPPQTDPDAPSSMSAVTTESGSDEVFIISAGPGGDGLNFTSYRIQDKSLKRSITSPGSVSDWLTTDHMGPGMGTAGKGSTQSESHYPRQRTWSARAFHDLLTPIPQLQKKWCTWTTNSPFTKLVNNSGFPTSARNQPAASRKVTSATEIEVASELAYSESSASTASYPLTHSAQKQRKLSSSNLKRSRFGNPYLGFLTSSPDSSRPRLTDHSKHLGIRSPVNSQSQGLKDPRESSIQLASNAVNGSKSKEPSWPEMDKPKPVFVISEEGDDKQPLVLAEHVNPCADTLSEPNIIHDLEIAMVEEQPVGLPLREGSPAESPNIRTDHDLWGEYSGSYRDSLKGCSSYKEQSYSPVTDTGNPSTHQHFDSLASRTLCQTSVQ